MSSVMLFAGSAVAVASQMSGNAVLAARVEATADAVRTRRAIHDLDAVRDWTKTRYGAKSWSTSRPVAARIEATRQGLDIRCVVTNVGGTAWWLHECPYSPAARRRT
jgi:Transposase DDE domain group 1